MASRLGCSCGTGSMFAVRSPPIVSDGRWRLNRLWVHLVRSAWQGTRFLYVCGAGAHLSAVRGTRETHQRARRMLNLSETLCGAGAGGDEVHGRLRATAQGAPATGGHAGVSSSSLTMCRPALGYTVRWTGGQEVAGSNPVAPNRVSSCKSVCYVFFPARSSHRQAWRSRKSSSNLTSPLTSPVPVVTPS